MVRIQINFADSSREPVQCMLSRAPGFGEEIDAGGEVWRVNVVRHTRDPGYSEPVAVVSVVVAEQST